jgi:hypothetical protein
MYLGGGGDVTETSCDAIGSSGVCAISAELKAAAYRKDCRNFLIVRACFTGIKLGRREALAQLRRHRNENANSLEINQVGTTDGPFPGEAVFASGH